MSTTTYKCEVLAEHIEGAIDIFSNFFVSPLFTRSGTGREVNAVDSENSKNMTNDARRRLQIMKALADPSHHYSKFSTGNASTLPAAELEKESTESKGCESPDRAAGKSKAEMVRDALLAFHKRHYRPKNMTVAIVGPQDLDALEELVVPRFSGIKDQWALKTDEEITATEKLIDSAAKDAPDVVFGSPTIYKPAFRPELQGGQWPILLTNLPLQSVRKLYLFFPLPPTIHLEDRSPYQLISHLLGHEGKGSVFSILQDENLADSLSAGPRLSERDQSLLQISVSLTEKGEAQWENVVKIVFEYCRLLQRTIRSAKGVSDGSQEALQKLETIWSDKCALASLRFHQTSPGQAYAFAPALAASVMKFGSEKCISSGSLLEDPGESLDLNLISDFVELLTPDNCIIERSSQAAWNDIEKQSNNDEGIFEFNPMYGRKTEPWYGIQYHLSRIEPSTVSKWTSSSEYADRIYFPEQNSYIPRNLELCDDLPPEAKLGPRIGKELEPPALTVNNHHGMSS